MSPKHKHILFVFLTTFSLAQLTVQGQSDSLKLFIEEKPTESLSAGKLSRPQVELGTGVLTYFGDIGNLGGYGKSYDLNWGYTISFRNRLSHSFGLNLSALFGKVSSSEQFLAGNTNFQSEIRLGGASLEYNFNVLLPKDRNVTPYVSLGISTFEFAPKGDLYSSDGSKYHYWDDGTIRRDLPTPAKSENGDLLIRDGVYETDLRESNEDTERYSLRSFSVPVGAGVLLNLTESFTLRMGTEFHFALTDNLDNVNSETTQHQTSKKGNDYFMYSNLALAYNLHYFSKVQDSKSGLENKDMKGLEYEDEDNDGVADIVDLCPFTPSTVSVDNYGCPLDYDEDGIPDYLDKEPNSDRNSYVNADGVTLSEEEIEQMYLTYADSIGNLQFEKSAMYTADIERKNKTTNRNQGYRVTIANKSNLSSSQISKMLSIADLKSEDTKDGITYYIGNFKSPIEALSRKAEVEALGIETKLYYNKYGENTIVDQAEIELLKTIANPANLDPNQIVFRVQIGAYRNRLSNDVFADVPELLTLDGNDGLTRYLSGSFTNIQDAADYKINLLLKGFEGAFVTSYRAGKRITLKEAGATVNSIEDITTKEVASGSINSEFVNFTIQLGSFDGRVPANVLSDYMTLGNVRPLRGKDGVTKYVYSKFETQKEAMDALRTMNDKGFGDAFIVGEFNGQIIQASEAQKIKGN